MVNKRTPDVRAGVIWNPPRKTVRSRQGLFPPREDMLCQDGSNREAGKRLIDREALAGKMQVFIENIDAVGTRGPVAGIDPSVA